MTIALIDLASATNTYIDDQVEVTVDAVTSKLQPTEEGTYTVTVTNSTEAGGVRLTDLVMHLTISPGSRGQLIPAHGAQFHASETNDINGPGLNFNDRVEEYFLFFPDLESLEVNSTLDAGEVLKMEDFRYEAVAAGVVTIRCHVHANVDVDSLFPRRSGKDGEGTAKIVP